MMHDSRDMPSEMGGCCREGTALWGFLTCSMQRAKDSNFQTTQKRQTVIVFRQRVDPDIRVSNMQKGRSLFCQLL